MEFDEHKWTKDSKYQLRVKTAEATRRLKDNLVLVEFTNSNYLNTRQDKNYSEYYSLKLEMPFFRLITPLSYLVIISL